MAALAGIALGDPGEWLAWTIAFSLALGFAGATQDVVVDGWRINVAPVERQALMASWSEVGYRIGVLAAGAGALLLADRFRMAGGVFFHGSVDDSRHGRRFSPRSRNRTKRRRIRR